MPTTWTFATRCDAGEDETTVIAANWTAWLIAHPEITAEQNHQFDIIVPIIVGNMTTILSQFAAADRPTLYAYCRGAATPDHVWIPGQMPDAIRIKITSTPQGATFHT